MKQDNAPVKAQSYSHILSTSKHSYSKSNWFFLRSNYPSRATLFMAPVVQSCCLIWCRLVRSRDFRGPSVTAARHVDRQPDRFWASKQRSLGFRLSLHRCSGLPAKRFPVASWPKKTCTHTHTHTHTQDLDLCSYESEWGAFKMSVSCQQEKACFSAPNSAL